MASGFSSTTPIHRLVSAISQEFVIAGRIKKKANTNASSFVQYYCHLPQTCDKPRNTYPQMHFGSDHDADQLFLHAEVNILTDANAVSHLC